MPDYEELEVSLTADQNSELREVIGTLVQELDDQYILVEREEGNLGVLRASHLAWLSYSKSLDDLEQYLLPTYELDGTGLTQTEISNKVTEHPDEVVLLYRDAKFEKLIAAPPELGDSSKRPCWRVRCKNCGRKVVLCGGRRRCPKCHHYAI